MSEGRSIQCAPQDRQNEAEEVYKTEAVKEKSKEKSKEQVKPDLSKQQKLSRF